LPKHWLDDLKTLHKKFARDRVFLNKALAESRREEKRIQEALLGRERARRARHAAAARKRSEERATELRESSEHFGAPSTSSIVEKADDQLERRGEVHERLDGNSETV